MKTFDIQTITLDPRELDPITIAEIRHFVEVKLDEQQKIKGRIARDLRRIGEDAFRQASAYTKLKAKYRAAHASRKKFAILDLMKGAYCDN